ncbi:MAG: rhodanese-like domain-containing protein [Kofleriaceae bacterium]
MPSFREIKPADAFAARTSARLVDVREPFELLGNLGRIPGAENVPLSTLPAAARTWERSTEIIVVCRSGARSTSAASLLVQAGFLHVANMTGGMLAYNAAALPISR